MDVCTSLHGSDRDNFGFDVIDKKTGKVVLSVEATDGRANLRVSTPKDYYIIKTNGKILQRRHRDYL